ncbi:MAG: DNA-deoxyinosine glycosylase [Treponema sp.]|nr:DNA-deoxyinosine glycosylase [Treponema sp.]
MFHPFPSTYNSESRILILGSFPSVQSRKTGYYYGHPQNRFWKVLAQLYNTSVPATIDEKHTFLLTHAIAVWDVIASCDITGSSDTSIKNVIANDITTILKSAPIAHIFTNGKKADALYTRFILPKTGIQSICLPSTSPANASWNLEKLYDAWKVILDN